MGLLSFLKRTSGGAPASASRPDSEDTVQQARTRARQRLVGAVVLVAVGVAGFSMLLGSPPRPMAADIPIEIARKDGTPPANPTPRTPVPAPDVAADQTPVLPPSVVTEAAAEPTPSPAPKPVVIAAAPQPPKPATTPKPAEPRPVEPKPTTAKPSDSSRAQALLDGKDAAGRFVVQVGAFADTGAASEARRKVEKLGLKTYTQVVNTAAGNRVRVRVGPFSSRDDADRAAGKIKSAGLPSAVLTL